MATGMDDGGTLDVPRCRDSRQIGGRLAGAGGRRSWDEIDMRLQTMGINGITLAHKLPLALSPGRRVAISAPALCYTHIGPECRCRLTPAILYIGMHAIGLRKWYKHLNNGPPSSPANLGIGETMPQSMFLVSQPSNTLECLLVSQGWAPPSNPSHLGDPPQLDSLAATWLMPVCQSQNKPLGNRRWTKLKSRATERLCLAAQTVVSLDSLKTDCHSFCQEYFLPVRDASFLTGFHCLYQRLAKVWRDDG